MNNQEFSDAFATLLNSHGSKAGFGDQDSGRQIVLDEYEKSLFLTKAQEDLVQDLYSGESIEGESYEETERLRRYLSALNKDASIEPDADVDVIIDSNSKVFTLPDDLWFITYEAVKADSDNCWDGKYIQVVPVRQDNYHRQIKSPFRGASNRRALRLDRDENSVEIIYPLGIEFYYVRYVRKPQPIILETLPEGLTIENRSAASECELNSALHQKILERAVVLAMRSKGIQIQENNR